MKTKKFRVARSGPTIDGREITPEQIAQMAANYSPAKYGARIWIEHYRSLYPDGSFKAMGDVLALSVEKDGDARVLIAEVDATPDLMKLSADRQKVYWSIEMEPNFAKTGEAYMVGLAVTDSPASLGTEMMTFAVKSEKAPEALKGHLYSEAIEGAALEEAEPEADKGPTLLEHVRALLSRKGKADDTHFTQVHTAIEEIAGAVAAIRGDMAAFASLSSLEATDKAVAKVGANLAALVEKLSATDTQPPRDKASGTTPNLTDC